MWLRNRIYDVFLYTQRMDKFLFTYHLAPYNPLPQAILLSSFFVYGYSTLSPNNDIK